MSQCPSFKQHLAKKRVCAGVSFGAGKPDHQIWKSPCNQDKSSCSINLFGTVLKLCVENDIPELVADTESELIVEEVMSKMIFLKLLVPQRKVVVVQEVMGQIVADVAKDTATVGSGGGIPAVVEERMGKVPEGGCEDHEKRRGHDQAILVHWKIVMNAVEQKVHGNTNSVVRKIARRRVSRSKL